MRVVKSTVEVFFGQQGAIVWSRDVIGDHRDFAGKPPRNSISAAAKPCTAADDDEVLIGTCGTRDAVNHRLSGLVDGVRPSGRRCFLTIKLRPIDVS